MRSERATDGAPAPVRLPFERFVSVDFALHFPGTGPGICDRESDLVIFAEFGCHFHRCAHRDLAFPGARARFTTTGSVAQATLSRHGVVYAAGTAHSTRGRMSLRLLPVRKLRPGHYTLTLISGSGRHETIHSEPLAIS